MAFEVAMIVNLQALVFLLMMIHVSGLTPRPPSPILAKRGCKDSCGNVDIPFPFGTTRYCSQDDSFWVTCNYSYDPPRLFMRGRTDHEIIDISLHGQLRMIPPPMASECYNGTHAINTSQIIELDSFLTVNSSANKFTTVGCNATGIVVMQRQDWPYVTGCSVPCTTDSDPKKLFCQSPISEDISMMESLMFSETTDSDASRRFNDCNYAFVVETSAFDKFKNNNPNLKDVKERPIVVDWAFGNGTSNTTVCKSANSTSYEPGKTGVYRCRCNPGYKGTPYLTNGCIDIDECKDPAQNNCTYKNRCKNTPGGFTCSCPEGYYGNGRGVNGCIKKHDMKIANVIIGIAFGIVALLLAAMLLQMEYRRRRSKSMKQKFFLQNGGTLLQEKLTTRARSPEMVRIFSASELQKATNDFHNSMIIGQGGFGTVYKGVLSDSKIVAIKKSKRVDPDQIEQFINEVFVLSQVNHRNVVRLIGCCLETEVPLLVYEFITNGTLSAYIHNQAKARFLNWEARIKIAAETASVLSYLHSAASTPIIHRDIKSDNILLDHTFTAKVSDFGASRLVPLDQTQLSTMVQGTFGYLDPEYMQTNQLTEKSDVYSFGVVLLELLTGRKAISFNKPEEEKNLANFFLSVLKQNRLFEILDENIVGDGDMEQITEVSRLAKGCLNVKGEDRPSMKEVAMELQGLMLAGKQSWAKNVQNVEEVQCLLGEGEGLNNVSNSSSVGYDSITNHVLLPMSGGR